MGRPTKRSEKVEDAILAALLDGNTRKTAAAMGGIVYDTFREWEKTFPEFSERVEKAEGMAQERLIERIRHAASQGTVITKKDGETIEYPGAWQAAAWLLERRWPHEYSLKQRVEMSGPEGGPIEHRDSSAFRDHEWAALNEAIQRHLTARRPAGVDEHRTARSTEAGDPVALPAAGEADTAKR